MTKRRVVFSVAITGLGILGYAAMACLQASPRPDTSLELLMQARESIGIGSRISAIKSLAVAGGFKKLGAARTPVFSPPLPASVSRLELAGPDEVGNIQLSFILPDQFRQDYTYVPNGVTAGTMIICRNGDDVWLANRTPDSVPDGVSVFMSDPPAPDAKSVEV